MEAIVLALRAEHRELDVMLNGLTQSEWERPPTNVSIAGTSEASLL